jgi:uncharacterized protein YciI
MPLFAVVGLDEPAHSAERRLAARDAHRAYVLTHDAAIAFVGPMIGDDGLPCGSLYVFQAETEQAVREWLSREPYVQAGLYASVVVRPFELGMNRLHPQDWPMARPATTDG